MRLKREENIDVFFKNRCTCKLTDRYAHQIGRLLTSGQAKCPRVAASITDKNVSVYIISTYIIYSFYYIYYKKVINSK